MKRNEWAFDYSAADLAGAAAKKRVHHEERRAWWEQKQAMVIEEVRASGLEITEDIAALYASTAALGGARVVVKDDCQRRLSECHMKIKGHDEKAREYAGWEAVLRSRPQTERRELHVDDWLFFFGG